MVSKHDNCFDFLRFVFAFIVVCGHLVVISQIPDLQFLRPFFDTYSSVTGFFVISGFLILQSYENSSSVGIYFIKRVRRLLPAYWFVVLGCAFGLVFMSSLSPSEYFFSKDWWSYLAANMTFMNFLHPSLPGVFENALVNDTSVNPALWTLKIEVAFYVCVPIIVWILCRSRRKWPLLVTIYVLSLLYRNGLHYLADIYHRDFFIILARQLPGFLSYFSIGMAAYYYKDIFLIHKNKLILPALAVFGLEKVLGIEYLMPLAFGIMVIWTAYSLKSLNNFAKYGDISYGIYIYHAPIVKILLTLGLFYSTNIYLAISIYLAIVILTGMLSWQLLEKRVLKR